MKNSKVNMKNSNAKNLTLYTRCKFSLGLLWGILETIINLKPIPPAKKKIGASLKNTTIKMFLAVGIKTTETKVIPERCASWDLFIQPYILDRLFFC